MSGEREIEKGRESEREEGNPSLRGQEAFRHIPISLKPIIIRLVALFLSAVNLVQSKPTILPKLGEHQEEKSA